MLIGLLVVLIWIMPLYALDLGNTTSTQINYTQSTGACCNLDGIGQELDALKSTSAFKFKDVQDLHIKILEILKGMRLLGQRNGSSYAVRCYEQLENESAELETKKRLIKC